MEMYNIYSGRMFIVQVISFVMNLYVELSRTKEMLIDLLNLI